MPIVYIRGTRRTYFLAEDEVGHVLLFSIVEYNNAKKRGMTIGKNRLLPGNARSYGGE